MTSQLRILFIASVAASLLIASCTKEIKVKYKTTDTGLRYIFHSEGKGKSPHVTNYVTLNMVYKLENDSVLYDSRQTGMPMRYQLIKPPFEGAIEEGIMMMGEGDSATFFVSADSMFEKVFRKPLPDFLKKGSRLVFDIKLLKVQVAVEAEAEMRDKLTLKFAAEQKLIDKYVEENNITQKPSATGLYVIITKKTKGKMPVKGDRIAVQYVGRFLDGEVFDACVPYHPYEFILGNGKVMPGFEEAFARLREGEKATVIIPSALGYGENGRRNPASGVYIVPPYTPLVYEVEVVSVTASKNL
jgi:FKBP-type peptidyl-prolyl cis-trans isomerase FkpA